MASFTVEGTDVSEQKMDLLLSRVSDTQRQENCFGIFLPDAVVLCTHSIKEMQSQCVSAGSYVRHPKKSLGRMAEADLATHGMSFVNPTRNEIKLSLANLGRWTRVEELKDGKE